MQATRSHPVAANNGVIPRDAEIRPTDTKREQAYKWMDDTVKAYPHMAAFRETRGYLAFLLGKGDDVEGHSPGHQGPDRIGRRHRHLGLVEADIGDVEMDKRGAAREAAVSSCKGIVDRGATPGVAERNAADLAAKALAVLGRRQGDESHHHERAAPR